MSYTIGEVLNMPFQRYIMCPESFKFQSQNKKEISVSAWFFSYTFLLVVVIKIATKKPRRALVKVEFSLKLLPHIA